MTASHPLPMLLQEIRACRICEPHLPLGPNPVLRASATARVLIAGQAPGTRVHHSGVPWHDASGDRLRSWLGLTAAEFYDESVIAIVPMGFCYPGRGKSGDSPPRPECSAHWHPRLFPLMPALRLRLVIGSYAHAYHLGEQRKASLTDAVRAYASLLPAMAVLPHPSPRNGPWLKLHPWFESDVLPAVRAALQQAL